MAESFEGAFVKIGADLTELVSGMQQAIAEIESINAPVKSSLLAAEEAFKTLKIKSSEQLSELAANAENAYLAIKASAFSSAGDISRAEEAMTAARQKYQDSLKTTAEIAEESHKKQEDSVKRLSDVITIEFAAKVAGALKDMGAALLEFAGQFDDAYDKIRIQTGKTGD